MKEAIKILFVDDERNVLRSIKRLFLDEDYEILTATSGAEGLLILSSERVQIVVADFRMPEMNGVDFLREVCARWPETIRIVLSGYADTAAIVSAINEGQIYKFVPKPWNDDELRFTIANAFDLYQLHRKNEELLARFQRSNEELYLINENLEAIVAERTAKIEFQNKVLKGARNILNALPVGVVGIDPEGTVVYCNTMANRLVGCEDATESGGLGQKPLSVEVGAAIEPQTAAERFCEHFRIRGHRIRIKGSFLQEPGQEGHILVFVPDGED